MNQNEELSLKVEQYMDKYFKMKDQAHRLNEQNKSLIGQIEETMVSLSDQSEIKKMINHSLEENDRKNYTGINNTQELPMVRKRQLPTVVKKESVFNRAGFANMAILLYGVLNIGIILAIALLK